ncbi:MAG: DUF2268 domain-containing putative Zn-dependent protease [Patescibacteria group bacterium]
MSTNIHILSASPGVKRYERRLRKITEATLKRVGRILPIDDIDIVLYENPDDTVPEVGGIGGYTPNAHTILISLDPAHPNFKQGIEKALPMTLAHEIHHAIRWRNPGYGTTLREALVTEGLADHFALQAGTRTAAPWSRALNAKERIKLLKRAEPLFNKPYNHADWFFGSRKNRIPRWTGYSLGYYLVAEYLRKHRDMKASNLVSTQASVIIS